MSRGIQSGGALESDGCRTWGLGDGKFFRRHMAKLVACPQACCSPAAPWLWGCQIFQQVSLGPIPPP